MKLGWLMLAVSAGHIAWAQTNDFLSWEQCLEQTRLHNPDLVAARAAVQELEYNVAAAGALFLPELDASASGQTGQRETDDVWSERNSSGANLSLQQDLFTGGGNVARRRRALAQLRVGQEQYRSTLSDVELRTRLAYVDVLYAQELIDLTHRIRDRRANNVRLLQLRYDGGRENAGSLARSKAQLAQSEFEVNEAERLLQYALQNLAGSMGQISPVAGARGVLEAQQPEDLNDLSNLAQQTPDYLIADTQIEAFREGLKVTRSSRFPQINLRGGVGVNDGSGFERYDGSWNVSLNASIPLYTGSRISSEVAAAQERVVQSEMELLSTLYSLLSDLRQQWNSYMDAVENEVVQQQLLEAEQLRAEISTAKYKQGLLSYEDWDIIESNLINQGKTYLQRRRVASIEQARWKNTLGLSEWYQQQDE